MTNGGGRHRSKFRRAHRWLGTIVVVFVLLLASTGIALNHTNDLGLDRKTISWSWLLEAYGMKAPPPYAGMVSLQTLAVVGEGQRAHVLLDSGELIESIDLGGILPGAIERVGLAGDRAVLDSGGTLYRSDQEVTLFEPWVDGSASEVSWSAKVDPGAAGLEILQTTYRGDGLTVERVLLDLHSGRIFAKAGVVVMDIVAIGMIVLALSGLILSGRVRRDNRNRR
jgi:hypothetical protein